MKDLNFLIDPTLGWTLTEARDINESGQIVGTGNITIGNQTFTHAFLLTPNETADVPEPLPLVPLLVITAVGVLVHFAKARRRRVAA